MAPSIFSVARCDRRGCATAASRRGDPALRRRRRSAVSMTAPTSFSSKDDVERRLGLVQRPADGVAAEVEQQTGGDVEPAHGEVDADEEDRDLHGAEEVLDVVVHPHQRRVAEPELVVERAQLLVRGLQLLLGGLQLLVGAAQLLVARLRFFRRGRRPRRRAARGRRWPRPARAAARRSPFALRPARRLALRRRRGRCGTRSSKAVARRRTSYGITSNATQLRSVAVDRRGCLPA